MSDRSVSSAILTLMLLLEASSSSSSSSSVDRWTQVVDLYVQSVVYHSEYCTIRIQKSEHQLNITTTSGVQYIGLPVITNLSVSQNLSRRALGDETT